MIKQISVFVENKPGRLMAILQALANEKIDIKAFSLADTTEFGVIRMVVNKPEDAKDALFKSGVVMRIGKIIAVAVDDEPGALMKTFGVFNDNGIAVEYMYAFAEKLDGKSVIAIRCDDNDLAEEKLKDAGIYLLSEDDVDRI